MPSLHPSQSPGVCRAGAWLCPGSISGHFLGVPRLSLPPWAPVSPCCAGGGEQRAEAPEPAAATAWPRSRSEAGAVQGTGAAFPWPGGCFAHCLQAASPLCPWSLCCPPCSLPLLPGHCQCWGCPRGPGLLRDVAQRKDLAVRSSAQLGLLLALARLPLLSCGLCLLLPALNSSASTQAGEELQLKRADALTGLRTASAHGSSSDQLQLCQSP